VVVELPSEPEELAPLWNVLLDLVETAVVPWVLIGGQMVALHAWRSEGETPRRSRDGDVLVNVRRKPTGTRVLAEHLDKEGFEFQGPSRLGFGQEFTRDGVSIDILAPDHLGPRANLETLHNALTVAVPGGTQAIQRAETIAVRLGSRTGAIPVPNLLGAILLKTEAIAVDDVPEAQRRDVGLLLSLVEDRDRLAGELTRAERRLLQRYPEFTDPASSAYEGLGAAREAAATYRRLAQI
jgi:hypothetical protein